MFRQTHPLVCFLPVWFQKELYNLSLFVIPFFFWLCFFWCISLCFQPIFTRFLQLIFCKINFFPLAFSLVTSISVRSMLTRIFVCITDIPVFLYAFLPQDLSCRTVYQISLRISDKILCFRLIQHFFRTSIYTAFFRFFIYHFPTHSLYLYILYY